MLKNKDIIILSNQSYQDRYWTSKQYITQELIKENRVLYVDGNYSFGKMILALTGKKWTITLFGSLRKKDDRLSILTPPPRLPLRNHISLFSRLHQYILAWSMKKAARKLGFSRPVLWSFIHSSNHLIGRFDEQLFIYHCVDDWSQLLPLARMGRIKQINRDEQEVAKKADLCFCTAKFLRDKITQFNTNTYYTPNAANTDLFSRALEPGTKIPLDVAALNKPVIGFVGNFEKKVDSELLYRLFAEKKDWEFVALGLTGETKTIRRLGSLPNVHFLGMKPKEALPGYLKKIDVAIIPFYINELGKSISPLKLFEYFAAGKPVVASDLPEIAQFSEVLWLAKDKEQFIEGIEEALKKKDDVEYIERLEGLAKQNSWPERIKLYNSAIEKTNTEES